MNIEALIQRSEELNLRIAQAVGTVSADASDFRSTVAMEALQLAVQHGQAVWILVANDLGSSALGVLRMQYDAIVRAVWVTFAATPDRVRSLAAPLTKLTLEEANRSLTTTQMIDAIKLSNAPADLVRLIFEFKDSSWGVLNASVHAGLHALRRHEGLFEEEMILGLRLSNGLGMLTARLMVLFGEHPRRQQDIDLVCAAYPDCMPPPR